MSRSKAMELGQTNSMLIMEKLIIGIICIVISPIVTIRNYR
jgi:hypothetical protein